MTTDEVRRAFHQTVANHALRGTDGYEPKCNWVPDVTTGYVLFPKPPALGDVWRLPVHIDALEAFRAYAYIMFYMNVPMPSNGGTMNCRRIARTAWPSLHAYGCAIDLPPNSYKSAAFQAAVLKIRTVNGKRVFTNLKFDEMHDQINVTPADLATGIDWSTVEGHEEQRMIIQNGSDPKQVTKVQLKLIRLKALDKINADTGKPNADGEYGPITTAAMKRFQRRGAVNLPQTGTCDWMTGDEMDQRINELDAKAHANTPHGGGDHDHDDLVADIKDTQGDVAYIRTDVNDLEQRITDVAVTAGSDMAIHEGSQHVHVHQIGQHVTGGAE